MIKYENSTLKLRIRNINHYTDIDPTVDFVFPGCDATINNWCSLQWSLECKNIVSSMVTASEYAFD
jgi:hypothetical protein